MIVVTGGAGLIGSAVARELNRRGVNDLILVDHLGTSEKWKNLRSLSFSRYMEKHDLPAWLDGNLKIRALHPEDIDAIIHLGACSSTTERDASYLIENNYNYSINLAEFARKKKIRFVYASSAATYGDGNLGFEDSEEILDELRPLNAYGYSKHAFDQWLKRKEFRGCAGIKYFNVFGPNEYHKGDMQSLVVKAYRQIRTEGKIRLFKSYRDDYADGEQMRDFFYVEDAAKMTVFLALDNTEVCGLFNAGSGIARTWMDLARSIFAAAGSEEKIEFVDMPETLRDRYQYYTCAPIKKIRDAGFNDAISSLEKAVGDYVRNYLMKDESNA